MMTKNNPDMTTIPITIQTREKLKDMMKYRDTYDKIILKLLEYYKNTVPFGTLSQE